MRPIFYKKFQHSNIFQVPWKVSASVALVEQGWGRGVSVSCPGAGLTPWACLLAGPELLGSHFLPFSAVDL